MWKKWIYSSGWFTLLFISPHTKQDHNSPHVSSMCVIHSAILHVEQPLSSNILYLSVRYYFNHEINRNFVILTVDWFRHTIILIVFLFLPPWKWPHEWLKRVGVCHIIILHSDILVRLLFLKYIWLMHKHEIYKTINFVCLAICLMALHPICVLLHTAHCNLYLYIPYC